MKKYTCMAYGMIKLEAFMKSDELLAPNWTISGLSSTKKKNAWACISHKNNHLMCKHLNAFRVS